MKHMLIEMFRDRVAELVLLFVAKSSRATFITIKFSLNKRIDLYFSDHLLSHKSGIFGISLRRRILSRKNLIISLTVLWYIEF